MDLDSIEYVSSLGNMELEERNTHHYNKRNSCSTNRKSPNIHVTWEMRLQIKNRK